MYLQAERILQLELALEDIARINSNSAMPNSLISGICANTDREKALSKKG